MKTKRTLLNYITDIIPLMIVSILGIFKIKFFIQELGDETLGLYQLFSQIMIYIALVDGGLSSAVLHSLYKPNIDDDKNKLNEIISAAFKVFSLIGIAIFSIAAVVGFFVPFFIKDYSFPYMYIVVAFLLFSLSNVIGYFFVPINAFLEVKGKKYITNLSLQIGQIVQSVLEIVLLLSGWSFFSILIMHSIVKLLSNIVIAICFRKKYKDYTIRNKKKDYSFTKKVKDLIFHKINGLVSSNIDVIIISKVLGLASVAIYSTYFYIINMLKNILGKLSSSMLAIVGNEIAKSKEKVYDIFLEVNSIMFFIGTVICIPLFFALDGFINLWYEGEIKTSILISTACVTYLFCFLIKETVAMFVNAAGLFKETKICALCDTIINLTLSIVLVFKFGISGVLFATAFSVLVAEYIMKNFVLHKHVFEKKTNKFYLNGLKLICITIFDLIIGILVFKNIEINNILSWFGIFTIYTLVNTGFIILLYKLFGETKMFERVKYIFKRSKA